jgi:hypothetical protein
MPFDFPIHVLPSADAQGDTANGPAMAAGRRALEAGNGNCARKWIQADGDAELTEVFTKALAVRKLGPAGHRARRPVVPGGFGATAPHG